MNFVYENLGHTKEQILHVVIHLDEKVPPIYIVLLYHLFKNSINKLVRLNTQFLNNHTLKIILLQNKYHERLTKKEFKLERGKKHTRVKHLSMGQFKNVARYYDRQAFRSKKKFEK